MRKLRVSAFNIALDRTVRTTGMFMLLLIGGIFSSPGNALYASIQAHAEKADAATSLGLNAITRGLVTPLGMTALARWTLLPKDAFDAGAYLEDLAVAAPWPEP